MLSHVTRGVLCVDWPGYTKRCFERPMDEVLRDRDIWAGMVEGLVNVRKGELIEEVADTLFFSFGMWEMAVAAAEDILVNMRSEVKAGVFWGKLYLVGADAKPEGPAMCAAATLAEEWARSGQAIAAVPEAPAGWREYRWWPFGPIMTYKLEMS